MIPALFESGLIIYEVVQSVIACIAVVLAMRWKRFEFLAGLFFLFLYTVVELIDTFFFTLIQGVFIDIAQFGFILLAIIFFILGMHPSIGPRHRPDENVDGTEKNPPRKESVLSILKKA